MKQYYESEVLFQLMEREGLNIPSSVPPYESEIKAYLINQVKLAYPKLTDYEAEWLLYNYTKHLPAEFPISSVSNVTEATINNVVPFAYKSAILKGQTLVNLAVNGLNKTYTNQNSSTTLSYKIQPNKLYLLIIDVKENTLNKPFRFSGYTLGQDATKLPESEIGGDMSVFDVGETGRKCFKVGYTKIKESAGTVLTMFCNNATDGTLAGSATYNIMFLEYQQGMENWNIPYFEGMQSVKMPVLTTVGKNLFNKNNINFYNNNKSDFENVENSHLMRVRTSSFKINSDNTYVVSGLIETTKLISVRGYDENKKHIANSITTNKNSFYVPDNIKYIHLLFGNNDGIEILASDVKNLDIQLELGSVATSYEPYKSNTLSTSDDVVLPGIDGVSDTLDCLTGEVAERIGEMVLDGSESWERSAASDNKIVTSHFYLNVNNLKTDTPISCDKFPHDKNSYSNYEKEGIKASTQLWLNINKNRLSSDTQKGLKEYLSDNPITVQYQLKTESIKTVELTTVNENGESVHFMPIEGTMNVQSSGEIIPPTFDMSVPVEATTQNLASFIDLQMEE